MDRAPHLTEELRAAYRRLRPTLLRAGVRTLDQALADPVYEACVRNLATAYHRRLLQAEHARDPAPQLRLL
jgi:hypothetical protein